MIPSVLRQRKNQGKKPPAKAFGLTQLGLSTQSHGSAKTISDKEQHKTQQILISPGAFSSHIGAKVIGIITGQE
jgi:hypothetical protein